MQLFYSFFKSLVGKDVVVELKNDLRCLWPAIAYILNRIVIIILICSICGTLHSVDQYLNIKLTDISVTDPEKYPHMVKLKSDYQLFGSSKHNDDFVVVICEKLLYSRLSCSVRSASWRWSWYAIITRCRQKRSYSSDSINIFFPLYYKD